MIMKRVHCWLIVICVGGLSRGWRADATPEHTRVILSRVFTIDRIYPTMEGPLGLQSVTLEAHQPPERLWSTAFDTEILDANSGAPVSDEFMCHADMDLPYASTHARVLNLSQGQMHVRFPPGFGLPVMSTETLRLNSQVLNLNLPH